MNQAWTGGALSSVLGLWQSNFTKRFDNSWWRSACLRCGGLISQARDAVLDPLGTCVTFEHWCCPACGEWDEIRTFSQRLEWSGRDDGREWQVAVDGDLMVVNSLNVDPSPFASSWLFGVSSDDGDVNEFLEWRSTYGPVKKGEQLWLPKSAVAGENAARLASYAGFLVVCTETLPEPLPFSRPQPQRAVLELATPAEGEFRVVGERPTGVCFDEDGRMWTASRFGVRQTLVTEGSELAEFRAPKLLRPGWIANRDGTIVASDPLARRVWRFTVGSDTQFELLAGTGERLGSSQVVASLIVVASIVYMGVVLGALTAVIAGLGISLVTAAGVARYVREAVPATLVRLRKPTGVAITDSGEVLISDAVTGRVLAGTSAGMLSTRVGASWRRLGRTSWAAAAVRLRGPAGLALSDEGDLYVAESHGHRVICVDSAGNSRQFAGTGRRRGGGDGVPSATARLGQPTGVSCDT